MEYFGLDDVRLDDVWQFDLEDTAASPNARRSPQCPSLETEETSSSFDDYNLSDEQVLRLVGLEMDQPVLMDMGGFDKEWDLDAVVAGVNAGDGPMVLQGNAAAGASNAASNAATAPGAAIMQLPMQGTMQGSMQGNPSMQPIHAMQPMHAMQLGHPGHPGHPGGGSAQHLGPGGPVGHPAGPNAHLMGHAPMHHPRPAYSRPAPDWSPHRRSISKMPLAQLYHIMGLPHDHNRARDREERIMRMLSESGFEIGQKTWIRDTEESFRRKVIEKIFMATKDEYGYSKALLEAIVRRGTYARMQSNLRRRRRHMIRASRRR